MSATTTLLVPIDFSPASELGIEHALRLAERGPTTIVLLHVLVHVPDIPAELDFNRSFNVPEFRRLLHESALNQLQAIERRLPQTSAERRLMVTAGDAAHEIVRVAEELGADLIVMSTHGRRGFDHLLHGSVAEKVVRLAPCPVLCVRPKRAPASV